MPALRPSNGLQNKVNIRPTNDRLSEAWAEDFQELGDILTDHADILDGITGTVSPNPFYGTFDSLATLQAAFPTAEENAYAIIDSGVGNTPQISVWNNVTQQWEGGDYTSGVVWLNNLGERPAAGNENTLYIVKDSGEEYYWDFGAYHLLNGALTNASTEIKIDGNKFRYVGDDWSNIQIGDVATGGRFQYQSTLFFGDLICVDNTGNIGTGIGTTEAGIKWKIVNAQQI